MNFVWLIDVGYITQASRGRGRIDYVKTKMFLEKRYNCKYQSLIFNGVDKLMELTWA